METGNVISNISQSIGFGFPAAFVDYDHEQLWISATGFDRANCAYSKKGQGPPFPMPANYTLPGCTRIQTIPNSGATSGSWVGGVFVFNSTDLRTWQRHKTDVKWSGPNTDIGRVYDSPTHPTPANLPPHRYVMATEAGETWAVNNNADGDLTSGWKTLSKSQAQGLGTFPHAG